MVCLQFFTDKEPDCTLQMIYKDFLVPPMFRSFLRNIPVSGCGCGHVTVYFYPCSGTFSLPQDGKHEGTKAWDDLTCHKMRNKMSVCQITLPDNWKRVKICINTDTRAQLLHHSWFAAPAECHLWSWNIPWASPLAMAFNRHLDSNMRRGFHGEGHCKIGLGFWWVMLRGLCSIKMWQFRFVCVSECPATYPQRGEEKFEENLALNWWKGTKKSELTSLLCNQTLFQVLLSLNEKNDHKLAAKPLWQAHLVSHPPPPSHNQLLKRIWEIQKVLNTLSRACDKGGTIRDSSNTLSSHWCLSALKQKQERT